MRYRAAEVFYLHNQFDEARRRFATVPAADPLDEIALCRRTMLMETALALGEQPEVGTPDPSAPTLPLPGRPAPTNDPASRLERTLLGNCLAFGEEDFRRIAEEDADPSLELVVDYVHFARLHPRHPRASQAILRIAPALAGMGCPAQALAFERWLARSPALKDAAGDGFLRAGEAYEASFEFEAALAVYDEVSATFSSPALRGAALRRKAVVLDELQAYERAGEALQRAASTFEEPWARAPILLEAAAEFEKAKAWPKVIAAARLAAGKPDAPYTFTAWVKLGRAYAAEGRDADALAAFRACARAAKVRLMRSGAADAASAATCEFEAAEADFQKFVAPHPMGQEPIGPAVKALMATAEGLELRFAEVLRHDDPETTVAAWCRIGDVRRAFGVSLWDHVRYRPPPCFDRADPVQYLLAQIEEARNRDAERAYRRALEEAARRGVQGAWFERADEAMRALRPDEFPKTRMPAAMYEDTSLSPLPLDRLRLLRVPVPPAPVPPARRGVLSCRYGLDLDGQGCPSRSTLGPPP